MLTCYHLCYHFVIMLSCYHLCYHVIILKELEENGPVVGTSIFVFLAPNIVLVPIFVGNRKNFGRGTFLGVAHFWAWYIASNPQNKIPGNYRKIQVILKKVRSGQQKIVGGAAGAKKCGRAEFGVKKVRWYLYYPPTTVLLHETSAPPLPNVWQKYAKKVTQMDHLCNK